MTSANPDISVFLETLEGERAIVRTLYRYGHALDYGDEAAFADCFVTDGVLDVRTEIANMPISRLEGREALRIYATGHTRAPDVWHKHLLFAPLIEIEGPQAMARSYFAVLFSHDAQPIVRSFGRYRDRLQREPDGRWRIVERIAEIESIRTDMPFFSAGRDPSETSGTVPTDKPTGPSPPVWPD